jgi:hypothetical protein
MNRNLDKDMDEDMDMDRNIRKFSDHEVLSEFRKMKNV